MTMEEGGWLNQEWLNMQQILIAWCQLGRGRCGCAGFISYMHQQLCGMPQSVAMAYCGSVGCNI